MVRDQAAGDLSMSSAGIQQCAEPRLLIVIDVASATVFNRLTAAVVIDVRPLIALGEECAGLVWHRR